MIAEQPIERASRTIDEMEAEIRQENLRRDTFYRMLHATDLVLWRLEELNRDGILTVPRNMRDRFHRILAELPGHYRAMFSNGGRVQTALDSVFEVQEMLLRGRHPELPEDNDDAVVVDAVESAEDAEDAVMDERIRECLRGEPVGLARSELLGFFAADEHEAMARRVAVLVERGEVRSLRPKRPGRGGRPARVYRLSEAEGATAGAQ